MKSKKIIYLSIILYSIFLPTLISSKFNSPYNVLMNNPADTPQISTNNDKKSIILMIGDGMGYEHLKLAKWIEVGKQGSLSFESLPFVNNVTTFSANNPITDSAAAATAIATGYKTNNGYLSVLPNLTSLVTILEMLQLEGKSSGVVTTAEITHATPAAFMTHVSSRYQTSEIARQIVEESGVEIIMGGGKDYFTEEQFNQMQTKGYQLIKNNVELNNISSGKVFGLFANRHLPYEINRNYSSTPSLANMTEKAIQLLSQNDNGFFLMVEGGRIDHAAHSNDKISVALEAIEFHKAVETAISYVEVTKNSFLIITADHETGGLNVINETLNSSFPSQINTAEENEMLRVKRAENVTVGWSTTGHTNANVPFYAFGMDSENLDNFTLIDNTKIFEIMNSSISLEQLEQPNDDLLIIIGLITIPIVPSVSLILYKKIKTRRNK